MRVVPLVAALVLVGGAAGCSGGKDEASTSPSVIVEGGAPTLLPRRTTIDNTSTTAPTPTTQSGPPPLAGAASSTLPTASSTPGPPAVAAGNQLTATATIDLVDSSRPTVSKGRRLSGQRSLPTTVVYPTGASAASPVVVFAHGYNADPALYQRYLQLLAANGYVVVAPSFPLTDKRAGSNIDRGDLPNQAGDLRFVVDQLRANPSLLPVPADLGHLALVGQSDGADTVLDAAYGPTALRADAVVALAPDPFNQPPSGRSPLLVVHGTADSVTPFSAGRSVYTSAPSTKAFLRLEGSDHLTPIVDVNQWSKITDAVTLDYLATYLRGSSTLDEAQAAGTVPGVASFERSG